MTQYSDSAPLDWLGWAVEYHAAFSSAHVLGRGKVVAYCDAPSVLIESDDGRKTWWRADLTKRLWKVAIPRHEGRGSLESNRP
jgi:photosystem II stability/assembly factor-like uncharacterized protein